MNADERIELIREKIKRAKKHLVDLEVARNRFFDEPKPYVIEREHDPQTGDDVFKINHLREPPIEIALIAGDVIHNVRSALDHLACQLVAVKGNPVTDQTSFPIFKGAKINKRTFTGKVEGMADKAKKAIRATKPYAGGNDALWRLHILDIEDKHRTLFITLVSVRGMAVLVPAAWRRPKDYNPRFDLPNINTPLKNGDVILTCEPGFEDNTNLGFDVAFREPEIVKGKPVLELLHQTTDFVDSLIVSFGPYLA